MYFLCWGAVPSPAFQSSWQTIFFHWASGKPPFSQNQTLYSGTNWIYRFKHVFFKYWGAQKTLIISSERRSSAAQPYISSLPRLFDVLGSPLAVWGSFITAVQTCNQSLLPEQMSPLGQIPRHLPAIKIKLDFISKLLLIQRSLVLMEGPVQQLVSSSSSSLSLSSLHPGPAAWTQSAAALITIITQWKFWKDFREFSNKRWGCLLLSVI